MRRVSSLFIVIWLALLTCTAWGQQSQSQRSFSVVGPHSVADVRAIENWCQRYTQAVEASDLGTYRAFWSEDVIWMPPDEPTIVGIDACMDHHRPFFEGLKQEETFSVKEIKFSPDFTVVRLDYVYRGVPRPHSDIKPVKEIGKAIFLMRRKPDGSWIATHCCWNLDEPRTPSTPE